ncbi:GspH/FimT family pseudopilin [Rheinheimera salexigens]|nr:GspH/FimT family pseudopilin [Rheinheimera salexigens]
MFTNKHYKKANGFTLIELMVTVAVVAITLTVAVPSFTGLINGNRLTGQANEIIAAFILARTEAIKQNQVVVLCHSSDAATCSDAPVAGWQGWLVMREGGGTVIASGQINTGRIKALASPAVSGASDIIRFTPQGLARTSTNGALNAVLRICIPSIDNNVRDVELRSGGRARITQGASASCNAPANPS